MTAATEAVTEAPPREILLGNAAAILASLPAMGKLMVIARAGGATHERIGPVEKVSTSGDSLRVEGACHGAEIALAPLVRVEIDRSSVMREKVYPRLEFRDAAGEVVVAVVGMEGLEPFEAALTAFARGRAEDPAPKASDGAKRPDLAEDDPALAPFAAVQDSGAEVVIAVDRPGLHQFWRGRIEAVKPAMGFLNVMTPDFHLHLEGGTVAGWQAEPGKRIATGADGVPTGLVLTSEAFA